MKAFFYEPSIRVRTLQNETCKIGMQKVVIIEWHDICRMRMSETCMKSQSLIPLDRFSEEFAATRIIVIGVRW